MENERLSALMSTSSATSAPCSQRRRPFPKPSSYLISTSATSTPRMRLNDNPGGYTRSLIASRTKTLCCVHLAASSPPIQEYSTNDKQESCTGFQGTASYFDLRSKSCFNRRQQSQSEPPCSRAALFDYALLAFLSQLVLSPRR